MSTHTLGEKLQGWFFPGWIGSHIGSSFVASIKRSWIAPIIFFLFILTQEHPDMAFLALVISLFVAVIIAFLFSVVVYPFLQLALCRVLQSTTSGKEMAMILLPLQQLIIWAVAIGSVATDYRPDWSPDNYLLQFSTLVAVHAGFQLIAYSTRYWRARSIALPQQIPTFEHELAAEDIERLPDRAIE